MKKTYIPSNDSGNFSSPRTPKCWSSERVMNPNGGSLRHINTSLLIQMSGGRPVPSKWEDAERWITSPVAGYEVAKSSLQPHSRRRKSKSGPLVPGYSSSSPAMPLLEHEHEGNLPLPGRSSVPVDIHLSLQLGGESESPWNIERSSSLPDRAPLTSYPEKILDQTTQFTEKPVISRTSSSLVQIVELDIIEHGEKSDVRDVQVDGGVAIKRGGTKSSTEDAYLHSRRIDPTLNLEDETKNISRNKKEEAKISAWERLQKTKAEAAIRKLEVKLEKKRTSEMERILNRLKMAEFRAREMREYVSKTPSPSEEAPKASGKLGSLIKVTNLGSWGGCFSFHST